MWWLVLSSLMIGIEGDTEGGVKLEEVIFCRAVGYLLFLPLYFRFYGGFITG